MGLKLQQVIDIAEDIFPDCSIAKNFNFNTRQAVQNPSPKNKLANDLVRELCDTYEPDTSADHQLATIYRVLNKYCRCEVTKEEDR